MNGYWAFLKKEWMESLRSYRLLVLGAVFLALGMMGPLSAKFMPELIGSMAPMMSGLIPEQTELDAWAQFFKNITQLGLIAGALVFSGLMPGEFSKGTLVCVLTKGLRRSSVVLAKFTMSALLWTVCYAGSFLVSWGYTIYFYPEGRVQNLFPAMAMLWLFGLLILAVLLLGGVLFRSGYGGLIFTGLFVCLLFLVNLIPQAQAYNPLVLASVNPALTAGTAELSDSAAAVWVTAGAVGLAAAGAVLAFRKKLL